MGSCVAYGCTNRVSKKVPGITFHAFPKNEERRLLWIKAVRRANWQPTKYSKLCSAHFQDDMFDRTSLAIVRLRENAVPTVFEGFPKYLQKVQKHQKSPALYSLENAAPSTNFTISSEIKLEPCSMDNEAYPGSPDKSFYERKIEELTKVIELKNKKIKLLQQQVRRCNQRFDNLSDLFQDLAEKKIINNDALGISKHDSKVYEEFLTCYK